jgi:hypothetical protein
MFNSSLSEGAWFEILNILRIKIENPGNCGIQFIEFHYNFIYISAALPVI